MSEDKRTIIGLYPGDVANAEDISKDMANYMDEMTFKKEQEEGFEVVGIMDKDTTEEEVRKIAEKGAKMYAEYVDAQ